MFVDPEIRFSSKLPEIQKTRTRWLLWCFPGPNISRGSLYSTWGALETLFDTPKNLLDSWRWLKLRLLGCESVCVFFFNDGSIDTLNSFTSFFHTNGCLKGILSTYVGSLLSKEVPMSWDFLKVLKPISCKKHGKIEITVNPCVMFNFLSQQLHGSRRSYIAQVVGEIQTNLLPRVRSPKYITWTY